MRGGSLPTTFSTFRRRFGSRGAIRRDDTAVGSISYSWRIAGQNWAQVCPSPVKVAAPNPLPVSVSQCELMARNAEDLAVRRVVRPASGDRRPVVCMPAAVPSESVSAATAVMRCSCAGVLTIALAPTARSAIGLILHRFRESHTSPPPMAAPGPRAGFPIELRYAAIGNGSAVCHKGGPG